MSSSYAADIAKSPHEGGLAAIQDRSGAWFAAERERWPLWMPVMVGLGIAVYFGLSEEPPPWLGPTIVAGAGLAGLAMLGRPAGRSPWLRPVIVGALAIAAGFAAAQVRAVAVGTRMLNERLGPTLVTGLVDRVESFPEGQRVTLHRPTLGGLSAEKAPDAVRVRLRGAQPTIRPPAMRWGGTAGDGISVRAVLTPPPPPPSPARTTSSVRLISTDWARSAIRSTAPRRR
jgi:competence protein ComEC